MARSTAARASGGSESICRSANAILLAVSPTDAEAAEVPESGSGRRSADRDELANPVLHGVMIGDGSDDLDFATNRYRVWVNSGMAHNLLKQFTTQAGLSASTQGLSTVQPKNSRMGLVSSTIEQALSVGGRMRPAVAGRR